MFPLAIALGLSAPLTVVQILVVIRLTDGLPAVALGVDPPERGLMRRGPRPPEEGLLDPIRDRLAIGGLATAWRPSPRSRSGRPPATPSGRLWRSPRLSSPSSPTGSRFVDRAGSFAPGGTSPSTERSCSPRRPGGDPRHPRGCTALRRRSDEFRSTCGGPLPWPSFPSSASSRWRSLAGRARKGSRRAVGDPRPRDEVYADLGRRSRGPSMPPSARPSWRSQTPRARVLDSGFQEEATGTGMPPPPLRPAEDAEYVFSSRGASVSRSR